MCYRQSIARNNQSDSRQICLDLVSQPQLLFPRVSSKVIVQTLKKKSDELEDERAANHLKASRYSDTETEELLALYHTALRIRSDIRAAPGQQNCASVSNEDAERVVPESLFYAAKYSSNWRC